MPGQRPSTSERRSSPTVVAPLVSFVIIGLLASRAIRDNSFIWHIRAGEVQLDTGRVLAEDVFSFTRTGDAWRTQSWLVELGYSIAESTFGGLAWGNWMMFIAGSAVLGLVGLAIYRSIGSVIVTGFGMVIGVWLLGPFLQPRPVVFSYVFLALLVVALGDSRRLGWTAVPIVWVWSAAHGSWVLGIGVVVLEALRTRNRRLVVIAFVALGATLVTAHGAGTWLIVLDFLESREALSMMQEWKPPAFQEIVQLPYLLIIAGIVVGGLRGRISVRDLVVILPFLLFGLTSRRAVFPATIVLLPWAVMCLGASGPTRATMHRSVVMVASATVALAALLPMLVSPLGELDEERFPSRAVVDSLEGRRSFHDIATGGYLIYAKWPNQTVYIDDRAELHGAGAIERYRGVIAGNFIEEFASLDIGGVIADPSWPLTTILIDRGWQVRAKDQYFVSLSPP